jgi:hypothetical protein
VTRIALALLPMLLANAACSVVLSPGEAQCETTADCTARGFPSTAVCQASVCAMVQAVDPIWGCLADVPNPTPDPTQKVTFTVELETLEQAPVTMATVDVCDKIDLDCTSTNPDYPKGLSPDGNGNVTMTVPQGFDGFVRVAGPTVLDARVFVGRPLIKPPNVKAVRLIEPGDYETITAYAGLKVDMTKGTAILLVEDCSQNSASGVTFSDSTANSSSQAFYLINQVPVTTATTTDIDGFGGILNLPPGTSIATATVAATKQTIGQTSFNVLAYTISYALITPTPQ